MAITTWAATTGDWDDSKFDRGWDGPAIAPAVGSLSISATAPVLKIEYTISPAKADVVLIQSYEWNQLTSTWDTVIGDWSSGPVPHVAIGTSIAPAKADLTLTGQVPAQGVVYTFPVANADLTVTGKIPQKLGSHFRSPGKGSITGLSSSTWDNYGGTWAESSDNWGVGTLSPTVGVTYTFPIDEADLTLSGYDPVRVKKDPTYLATIIAT